MKKINLAVCLILLIALISGCTSAELPEEEHNLTEITLEGNPGKAYNAVCEFLPFRLTNRDVNTVYRPQYVTFDGLDAEYVLSLAFATLPEKERETVTADAGVYSPYGYVNGEVITENIEYTVYTLEEIDCAVEALFGNGAKVEYKDFYPVDGTAFKFDGDRFLRWNAIGDGDFGISGYSVFLKAETESDGSFVYVYDKFISFEYETAETYYMYISAAYSDGARTDLLCKGDGIPYEYTADATKNFSDSFTGKRGEDLFSGRFDYDVFGNLMKTYKHTFALAENGTYYWVSSEPVDNG